MQLPGCSERFGARRALQRIAPDGVEDHLPAMRPVVAQQGLSACALVLAGALGATLGETGSAQAAK